MYYGVGVPQGIEQLLETVAATARQASISREDRNRAIRSARAAGATFRAIAEAANLSAAAIHKIIRSNQP